MSRKILQVAQDQQAEEYDHTGARQSYVGLFYTLVCCQRTFDLQAGLMAHVHCRHKRHVTQLQIPMDNDSDLEEEDFSDEDEDYLKEYVCGMSSKLLRLSQRWSPRLLTFCLCIGFTRGGRASARAVHVGRARQATHPRRHGHGPHQGEGDRNSDCNVRY